MTKQISLFDCLGDDYANCKSQTSTDWKWSMKDGYPNIGYICGMSVPPIMMKRVVERIIASGIFN